MMFLTFLVTLVLSDNWGCSEEEYARGCKLRGFEGNCVCPPCMDGLADVPYIDSYAQSTREKCQALAFDYGGTSYAWGLNGEGCYTYKWVVDTKTAKATSGKGKWVTCSPMPRAYTETAVGAHRDPNYELERTARCNMAGQWPYGYKNSGRCDRRKDWNSRDSCNYCIRGSRWVGLGSLGNHWCCERKDLAKGDCKCTRKDSESSAVEEKAVADPFGQYQGPTRDCYSFPQNCKGCRGYLDSCCKNSDCGKRRDGKSLYCKAGIYSYSCDIQGSETEEAVGCDNYCLRMTGSADYCGCSSESGGNEAAVGRSQRCRVPKGKGFNLPRESGKCDIRKDYKAWDSCNYCVRGNRWVGWMGIGNHWCCTESDLQNGDCKCTKTLAETTDEEAVGCDNYCLRMTGSADYCGCSSESGVEGSLAYTKAQSNLTWVTYGLAAVGLGSLLYGAGSFYLKA